MFCHTSYRTAMKPAALAVLAALACLAHAEEQTLPQVTVQEQAERADGPVTGYRASRSATVTKTDTALRDVPQSIQVIPETLVKDQAMRSMAQVLRYVPGASMNPGEGGRDQPVLRGISTTADFYVDGIRDDALYFRDPYNAERIEILKGPSGMTFGRGGAGGVINRVSKRPLDAPLNQVEASYGSYDDKRASADISGRLSEAAGYRINAMAEDANGFREGYKLKRHGINPVLEFAPGSATSLLLGYEHFEDERTVDRGIPSRNGAPYDTARATFFGNPGQSPSKVTVDGVSAKLEHGLAANVTLRNSFRATHYDTLRQNVQPNSSVDATGLVKITAYSQANQRTNVFNQTEVEARVNGGGVDHLLLAGLELGRQDSNNTRFTGYFGNGTADSILVNASNPKTSVVQWRAAGSDTNNRVVADIAALYLQDQITLTPQWKAVLGLRYDRFSVAIDDRSAANVDLSRTDTAASPRAGLIYQPDAVSSYYTSYSYAFIPSGETLSLAANNAELEPEKAKNWEVGGKWDLNGKLSATAALFRLDRANVKAVDPANPTKLQLSGLQRTEGLEVGLQGQLSKSWQVYAGFAALDARVDKTTGSGTSAVPAGNTVALVPKRAASWWNRVELGGGWAVGLGLVYQSSVYANTASNAVTLPAFSRADGAIYYQIDKKTRLALNVENLFDRRYYASAGGDNNIIVGSPRAGQLTLSTAF